MRNMQLHGFNNLTKNLNISVYKIDYLPLDSVALHDKYQTYIQNVFQASMLSEILDNVTEVIGAQVLSRSKQDYQPHGASSTHMIADCNESTSLVNHLNKSHICAHTYPDTHQQNETAIFRLDLDISTCGVISPLKALNYLLEHLQWDVVTMDYKVRGFTRDVAGNKHYQDEQMINITDYLLIGLKDTVDIVNDNQAHLYNYHSCLMKKSLSKSYVSTVPAQENLEVLQNEKRDLFTAYRK